MFGLSLVARSFSTLRDGFVIALRLVSFYTIICFVCCLCRSRRSSSLSGCAPDTLCSSRSFIYGMLRRRGRVQRFV